MSKALGDIEYNEKEYLNLGADYQEINQNLKAELHIIDLKVDDDIYIKENEEQDEEIQNIENAVLEAKYVAKQIKEMIEKRIPSLKQR